MITNIALSAEGGSASGGEDTAFEYDDLDRLISEKRVESGSNVVYDLKYSWDEVGNRLTKTNGAATVSYAYSNRCNRLTSWTAASTNDFADYRNVDISGTSSEAIGTNPALGQLSITNIGGQAVVPAVTSNEFSSSSFALAFGTNQLVAAIGDAAGNVGYATNTVILNMVTNGTYLHNDAGCVTNIQYNGAGFTENIGLSWNSQYQLTEVTTNGTAVERNGFDALGRRVWNWNGTETNYFVYDGNQIIADVDSTGGLRRAYVWGPGVDNLLAMTVYTGATVKTYFALTDHLRSVHAMADETGTIVEQYRMDAWGRTTVYDGNGVPLTQSTIGNRYVWQGREISWVTGLYHFRFRTWDPISGRFLSNDPIGISGGLNMYILAGNCVTMFRDPFGLCRDAVPWVINTLRGRGYSEIADDLQRRLNAGSIIMDENLRNTDTAGQVGYFSTTIHLNPDRATQTDAFTHTVLEEYAHARMNQNVISSTFVVVTDVPGKIVAAVTAWVTGRNYTDIYHSTSLPEATAALMADVGQNPRNTQ